MTINIVEKKIRCINYNQYYSVVIPKSCEWLQVWNQTNRTSQRMCEQGLNLLRDDTWKPVLRARSEPPQPQRQEIDSYFIYRFQKTRTCTSFLGLLYFFFLLAVKLHRIRFSSFKHLTLLAWSVPTGFWPPWLLLSWRLVSVQLFPNFYRCSNLFTKYI